jgi:hypothetical protein
MFRNDHQLALACRALLAQARLERFWTSAGPTREALELLEADGGALSSGERVMLLGAFAIWNGSGDVRLAEIIDTLDVRWARPLCSLVISAKHGPDHVDSWLEVHDGAVDV